MNNLRELIGQKVIAYFENENEEAFDVKCKVVNVKIEDYYFEEKDEPIYILVDLENIDTLPEGIDHEELYNYPLSHIRKP